MSEEKDVKLLMQTEQGRALLEGAWWRGVWLGTILGLALGFIFKAAIG
jgi:hypothetical protein